MCNTVETAFQGCQIIARYISIASGELLAVTYSVVDYPLLDALRCGGQKVDLAVETTRATPLAK